MAWQVERTTLTDDQAAQRKLWCFGVLVLCITLTPPLSRTSLGRRWSSNPPGKCSYERWTRGTACGTMRSMCGADAGCLAINYQSLTPHLEHSALLRGGGVGAFVLCITLTSPLSRTSLGLLLRQIVTGSQQPKELQLAGALQTSSSRLQGYLAHEESSQPSTPGGSL